jgi:hypothetical protein
VDRGWSGVEDGVCGVRAGGGGLEHGVGHGLERGVEVG